jgi:hypothetical protein
VDQQTLIMGAGFGVVFVGVLITICYLYLVGGSSQGSEASSTGSKGSTPAVTPEESGKPRMGIADPEAPPAALEDKELPRDIVLDITQRLSDVLMDRIDNPARARTSFESVKDFIETRRRQGYIIPDEIETRLREMEAGLAEVEAEETVEETPVEEAPVDEAGGHEASKEQPPVEKTDSDLDLDDLNLDDLEDLDSF